MGLYLSDIATGKQLGFGLIVTIRQSIRYVTYLYTVLYIFNSGLENVVATLADRTFFF